MIETKVETYKEKIFTKLKWLTVKSSLKFFFEFFKKTISRLSIFFKYLEKRKYLQGFLKNLN